MEIIDDFGICMITQAAELALCILCVYIHIYATYVW